MATGGNDFITGGEGNDTIEGLGGNDTLVGELGDDSLDGGNDADSLLGGEGNDTLLGGQGNDTLIGGDGVEYLDGGDGNDLILEPVYNGDALTGGAMVYGGLGDDTIEAGRLTGGTLVIDGGGGTDTLRIVDQVYELQSATSLEKIVYTTYSNIHLTLGDGVVGAGQTLEISAGYVNNFYLQSSVIDGRLETDGHLNISTLQNSLGEGEDDQVYGGGQADTIRTYLGNDTIEGGAGNDTIDGGTGLDTAVFSGNYAGYLIETVAGGLQVTDTVPGDGNDGVDLLQNINALQFDDQIVPIVAPGLYLTGTGGTDSLAGGEGNDTIEGLGGNDTLVGELGDDSLDGGNDADSLLGGEGNDTLLGGQGNDTLIGGDGVEYLDGGDGNDLILEPVYNGDALTGGAMVYGGLGDDTIEAGRLTGGTLVIDGGGGTDTLRIVDQVYELQSATSLEKIVYTTYSNIHLTLGDGVVGAGQTLEISAGYVNNFYLQSSVIDGRLETDGHLNISTLQNSLGEGEDDQVYGGGQADTIRTYLGNDTIEGGAGNDTIDGGTGLDTAVFSGNYAGYLIETVAGGLQVTDTVPGDGNDGVDLLQNINALQFDDQIVPIVAPGLYLTGTGGTDSLAGGEGNDTIEGLGGNDTLVGELGDDSLDGGNDADSLLGGEGNDTLLGGQGNDTLIGGDGVEYLDGGDGNDLILEPVYNGDALTGGAMVYGGLGDDTIEAGRLTGGTLVIDGGGGTDTLRIVDQVYELQSATSLEKIVYTTYSNIHLTLGDGVVGAGQTLEISAGYVNNFYLQSSVIDGRLETDGHLNISTLQNSLGEGEDDQVYGGGQADTIRTYLGNDTIEGGAGNDTIDGGTGLDTAVFSGNYAGYLIETVAGGLQVTDTVPGDGNDGVDLLRDINVLLFDDQSVPIVVPGLYLTGTDGTDSLAGGEGNDTIDGGLSGDTMSGAEGNDLYYVDNLGDLVSEAGGQGVDRVIAAVDHVLSGEVEDLDLAGNADNGTGNALANMIRGNDRANQLDGSSGADSLEGGFGNDVYYVDDAGDQVIETDNDLPGGLVLPGLGGGSVGPGLQVIFIAGITDTVLAAVNYSLANLDYVEHLTLTDTATEGTGNTLANELLGNTFANLLLSLEGDDYLSGAEGNDTLDGAAGNDTLDGGADNDSLTGGLGVDNALGGDGNDTLIGNAGADTLDGGADADLIYGSTDDDSILGAAGIDTLVGNAGNDTINGGADNDQVFGSVGNDYVLGGLGADVVQGNAGNDTVIGGDGTGTDTADGNDSVDGGAGDDSLFGGFGADLELAGAGFDTLIGNAGNDTLDGGADGDLVYGSAGDDSIVGGAGIDTLVGNANNDTLDGGADDDQVFGSIGDDLVLGGLGADVVSGNAGNDTVVGGAGNDTMQGNVGTDTFRYDATSLNTLDVAAGQADFVTASAAGDLISMLGLNDELTIAGTALSALTANALVGNALNATNNIAFTGGVLQIDLDGNDTFNALNDFQLQLTGVTSVTYNSATDQFQLS